MKIMQVIPSFCFGGAEIMCENLCCALGNLGHEVVAVCLYAQRTPISERMEKKGIRIRFLDKKLGLDVSMVPKLCAVMKQERPDVVHTHLDVIKYAALAARLSGVRSCVHTVHSVAQKEAEGRIQKIINNTYYHLGWSHPVALSPEIRDTVTAFYGLDSRQVSVIFNGVDRSRCIPKVSYAAGEQVHILHVGRFDTPKNHAGLVRAFCRLHREMPQVRLHLVGDGELRPRIEGLVQALGVAEAVTFHGMQADVYPYLHQADVFVLPSLYEGIPMTIIEAMGTGLPICAARVGGIPDLIRDEATGLLCGSTDESLTEVLMRLVGDAQLRERLGKQAREESVCFSAQAMAQAYCGVYQRRGRG